MFKNCLKIPLKLKKYKNYEIIKVDGKTNYKGFNYNIPGDISSAAFFIALTILANKSRLKMKNVNYNKSRIGIIEILKKMRAKIKSLILKIIREKK